MNSKRQTIWLVSMLSLMVVLSAYYLLTDSPGSKGITDVQTQAGAQEVVEGIDIDQVTGGEAVNEEAAAEAAEAAETDGAQQGADGSGAQDSETQAEEKNADKETSAETGLSPEDQAVLEQFEAGGVASQFQDMGTRSQERVNAEYEKLMSEISSASAEESTKAIAELDSFEMRQGKLADLRDQLEKDFKNVVIDENGESVKVVVQSQKLERSQAAAIITKVSTSLNISAGDVLVQYLP